MTAQNPIGVFDSGVGGLTVYKALYQALPHEDFIYLGDTARVPYGTKSAETVSEYTLECTELLRKQNIKLLVVACNTVASQARHALRTHYPDLPCIDVLTYGAMAAAEATISGRIAVLATEGTVRSGAYTAAIKRYRPDAEIEMLACSFMVTLAEEGRWNGTETEAVVGEYIKKLNGNFDTLVLGCTHFPLFTPVLKKLIKPRVKLIDSADITAIAVHEYLHKNTLLNPQKDFGYGRFMVTDAPERFERLAQRFLDKTVTASKATTQQIK